MAEINTIARPYAEALFRVAKKDQRPKWLTLLEALAEIATNPAMQAVVGDPRLSSDQLYSVIEGVMGSKLDPEAKNFVEALIANNRLAALPEITSQFRELKNQSEGSADAVIYSAFPLEGEQLKKLTKVLEERFKQHLTPEVVIDTSLIGGVRVVVGDEVLDSSVRGRLDAMRVALAA
jgi:F-type H+-transporting ATPase subunit delta